MPSKSLALIMPVEDLRRYLAFRGQSGAAIDEFMTEVSKRKALYVTATLTLTEKETKNEARS